MYSKVAESCFRAKRNDALKSLKIFKVLSLAFCVSIYWTIAYPDDRSFAVIGQSESGNSSQADDSEASDMTAVLDPSKHPESPDTRLITLRNLVPLDHSMSWTERFLGNEEFNPATTLPQGDALVGISAREPTTGSDEQQIGDFDATGTIRGIQTSSRKLKIAHGPVPKLDMPAMSMVFKVDPALSIDGLKKGQQIAFNVESTASGMVLTEISSIDGLASEEQKSAAAGKGDATGIVKSVKPAAGKVKIQHGPIEKFGMPAMTMVFGVADKSILDQVESGETISFDVDNTSAGFVVTRIESVKEVSQ